MSYRIGTGIDYHQLESGLPFWIGGVQVPHHLGAKGHSDADVLLHAICDALLGALSLGDIGKHFPDTDASYKGIDSKILLKKTISLIHQQNYRVVNVDSTLCLQAPKIASFITSMQECIAQILEVGVDDISIKATTTEKLGFIGREEGVMAQATVLLKKENRYESMINIPVINQSGFDLPSYATEGSAGMDLRASIPSALSIQPLERKLIPTGLRIALPQGFEAQIRPRSGLALKQGITCLNTPGTIDTDYRGEIGVILINLSQEIQVIQPGDRIAQMIIARYEKAEWESVLELKDSNRGEGGFGHTGNK